MGKKPKAGQPTRRHRRSKGRTGIILLGLVLVGAAGMIAWAQFRPGSEPNDPDVVVNLTTMVGKRAPAFTLADSEGRAYTITPGEGRRLVLVFHMGSV